MAARRSLLLLVLFVFVAGCAPSDVVVLDKIESIADGHGFAWKLDPGTYKVDLTASNDGVTIKFIGCSCPGASQQTQTFSTICELTQTGQVAIDNPSMFGTGPGSTVTVKITRLGRSA